MSVTAKMVALLLMLSGCASERYLTPKEDADLREWCKQGCTIIPTPLWDRLKKYLGVET